MHFVLRFEFFRTVNLVLFLARCLRPYWPKVILPAWRTTALWYRGVNTTQPWMCWYTYVFTIILLCILLYFYWLNLQAVPLNEDGLQTHWIQKCCVCLCHILYDPCKLLTTIGEKDGGRLVLIIILTKWYQSITLVPQTLMAPYHAHVSW